MATKLPGIPEFDYTMGVIDGLKWCLNCGAVASVDEICAQIKKLNALQEDSLKKMEEDFDKRTEQAIVNNTYDIITDQILETFPSACNIVRKGVFHESTVVEFTPYDGANPYSATLISGNEKVVFAVII